MAYVPGQEVEIKVFEERKEPGVVQLNSPHLEVLVVNSLQL